MTTIDQRDAAVIQLVTRFRQLTASHIRELLFAHLASHTPCDRTLRRLVDQQFLMRLEFRRPGGSDGGSGHYVYQLGREGHKQYRKGAFKPWSTINRHALAIADTYLALVRLERQGIISINGYTTEPNCHVQVGKHKLEPDLYISLNRLSSGQHRPLWLEVDRDTEHDTHIKKKLANYWHAYSEADASQFPEWPGVIWIALTDWRAKELRTTIAQGPKEAQKLFRVMTLDEFAASF